MMLDSWTLYCLRGPGLFWISALFQNLLIRLDEEMNKYFLKNKEKISKSNEASGRTALLDLESRNLAFLFFFRKFFPATFPFLPNNFQKCKHYTFIQAYTYIRDSTVWEKCLLKNIHYVYDKLKLYSTLYCIKKCTIMKWNRFWGWIINLVLQNT